MRSAPLATFIYVFFLKKYPFFLTLWDLSLGVNVLNSALEASYKEARVFRFKAEEAERQLALLRSKASARNEQLAGDHAKSLRHAERKGMSNYAAMVGARASQFKAEYQQLKEA